jgi:hypothetical protein
MPKTEIDYSNTIIYKIICKDPNVKEVYVGHTTNFVQRKHAHKQSCTNIKSRNYNCKVYDVIRNNNGWENWNMVIVNFFNCKDHYEARMKEQEYFILLNATLNSIEPLPLPKPKIVPTKVTEYKKKQIFSCEKCDIHYNTSDLLEKHNNTKKHKLTILEQTASPLSSSKKTPQFVCEKCDFKCSKQSEYDRHVETIKHKMVLNGNIKTPMGGQANFSCVCGNEYKYRPGLSRHKRTCPKINMGSFPEACEDNSNTIIDKSKYDENDIIVNTYNNVTKDEILLKLIKDNDEMMKIIKGQQEQINNLIPKLGSTTNNTTNNNMTMNNNFNLNVFLNEKCKGALNMSEFIDSLKITLDDLLFSKNNGITSGITDVMIKGLKELDIYKRPIHCTDIKRDIMYIKDDDKWQKDTTHDKIKNTIVKIADMERSALQQWAIDNPDWIETEQKQIQYLTMMRSICEPIENYDKYERKIVKNVGKEIIVDKNS